ncbi:MAG TPA: DUF1549 and DUF1553 domain-containing protein [Gemmataceae bacterium]|nr:DUF1549 and DUF1553 domain-containing protein [Gemmataceae bacterium]
MKSSMTYHFHPYRPRTMTPKWSLILLAALSAVPAQAAPVSFRNDVMAVLSRGGCNQGACHGNQNGKNGFKLSLRGQDPDWDLNALTRDTLGRRTDRLHPADSLILAKATGNIPHEGGKRFDRDSLEYRLLLGWIAEGLRPDPPNAPILQRLEVTPREQVLIEPADRVALRVRAVFSDGHIRDVTNLAVFETSNLVARVDADGVAQRQDMGETTILVRYLDRQAAVQLAFVPARPGFVWPNPPEVNDIDRHVFAKLRTLRMTPSALAADAVFLRRAYLDTLGILPTPAEVRNFLADTRSDKRARLIDALLQRPEFADFWSLKWADLLHCEEKVLDRKGVQVFHDWIRRGIADGKPLNEFARELLAGRGSTYSHPAANWYRALRDPQDRAEAAAQVFLGIRMKCARCHNHPFDRWTQTDYHSLAAFFSRVQYRIVENNRRDKLDKHEFDGEQIVWMDRVSEIKHPVNGDVLRPLFLGADTPTFAPDADRLLALADWIARPNNPFFARAQVNRVWYHLLGRGIIEPNDDSRASNPPVNAPLLDALSKDFVAHHFDLRHLVRTIMNSRTYQLSAVPNETNRDDEANFAHALVRPLQAEQLLDALAQVTGVTPNFPGYPAGVRAGQLPGVSANRGRRQRATDGEKFLASFGKPIRLLSCECERSEDTTLNQAFQLITGPLVNKMLSDADNRIGRLLGSGKANADIVEEFYLASLCRLPSPRERRRALAMIDGAKDRRAALEDLLWGLVNAKEFLLRR